MSENETSTDDDHPTKTSQRNALRQLSETNDAATLFECGDVSTEFVNVEVGHERFEQNEEWAGIVLAGIVNDDGEILLVHDTAPETHHKWVLPHGVVEHSDRWIESATDWVEGLTGITPTLEDVVHVRRNNVVLESDTKKQTTTYHVFLSGTQRGGDEIAATPRYDWAVESAAWHDSIPETGREQEYDDIALFIDQPDLNTQ